jgi:hypothetical protein
MRTLVLFLSPTYKYGGCVLPLSSTTTYTIELVSNWCLRDYFIIIIIIIIFIIIRALRLFVGHWPLFQFLDTIHRRARSLNGRSARRNASAYTQDKINTE